MSDEGFDIPIGGDLSSFVESIERVVSVIERIGSQINAAFAKANQAVDAATSGMQSIQAASIKVAASAQGVAASTQEATSKLSNFASIAGNAGNAATGAAAAVSLMARASRAFTGVSLAASIVGAVGAAGGLRAAFAKIPAAMRAIASNPTLRKLAAGAAVAVAAVLAIRGAWRAAGAASRALRSAATATFSAVVAGARRAGEAVKGTFSKLASMPGKLAGAIPGLPMAGIIGGLGGLAGAVTLAVSSISSAAQMETLETAFAPLLGSADAAKARIGELSDFAAKTPFELPEIAQASRVLEVLTRGALSTGDGLRMVGDIASSTQQPFQELATWIGRLYDGLQSGRPVGEAMARLQELGVITGGTRAKLEALQKSGANGDAIWTEAEAALNRFGGSMERQSGTWSGKMSTLRDEFNLLRVSLGAPLIEGLKPFLDMAIAKIQTLKDSAAAIGLKIKTALNAGLAAFQTGNLTALFGAGLVLGVIDAVNKFSSGIRSVMAYLSTAMSEIMKSSSESWNMQEFLGIFADLGRALGSIITAAILSAIDHIPGIDTTQQAKQESTSAENSLRRAGNRLEDFNGAQAFQEAAERLKEIHGKAMAAAAKAGSAMVLDRDQAQKNFDEAYKPIQEQINKNNAEIERLKSDMDGRLQKPGGPEGGAFAAAAKAIEPSVTSLGRIGGGGAPGVGPMVTEQKRTNSVLNRIESRLFSRPASAMPVIA